MAALLLSLAFCYDLFFVFLTPLFFEESVMVKVATGEPHTHDPIIAHESVMGQGRHK